MPVITRFYGILIKMYFREHGSPHFHAVYNEYNGVFTRPADTSAVARLPHGGQGPTARHVIAIRLCPH